MVALNHCNVDTFYTQYYSYSNPPPMNIHNLNHNPKSPAEYSNRPSNPSVCSTKFEFFLTYLIPPIHLYLYKQPTPTIETPEYGQKVTLQSPYLVSMDIYAHTNVVNRESPTVYELALLSSYAFVPQLHKCSLSETNKHGIHIIQPNNQYQ